MSGDALKKKSSQEIKKRKEGDDGIHTHHVETLEKKKHLFLFFFRKAVDPVKPLLFRSF